MPYSRGYSRRGYRRGYRRRSYGRKAIGYGQIGRKIFSDVKWLKSMINVEYKFIDVTGAAVQPSTTAILNLINGLTQGDTTSTRDGSSIKMVGINMHLTMTMDSTALQTSIRVMLVIDKQPNGAVFSIGNYLNSSTNVNSLRNPGYGGRFITLYDKIHTLTISGQSSKQINYYKKCGIHTKYTNTGNAGTIADITDNSLYIVLMSNLAATLPTVDYQVRLRWIDN